MCDLNDRQFEGFPGMFGPPFGQPSGQFPFGPMFGFPFGQFGPPFGQGPGMFPPGQGQFAGPPSGPPPAFTPQQSQAQVGVLAVDPGAIRPCRFRFVYIWLTNRQQFWAWLVFVGPRSVAGWRWNGFRWVYFGVDIDRIESFVCF